jgi:hypothetical protein
MRLRVAKVGKDAIAHEFGDKPTGLYDVLSGAAVVRADDLTHVLGVEASGQRRGTNEIAEHDGELATLSRRRGLSGLGDASCGCWPRKRYRIIGCERLAAL